jgi:gamma-glutamyltranspeptidase/glutathione hydrolase
MEALAMGGNAADAAIATAFALTVVEPSMVGIFGAGFIVLRQASTGELVAIDNYACAPLAARPDMYQPVSDAWPDYMEAVGRKNRVGHLAVGVPGALKAWCHVLERYGALGLEDVLQPALRYARRGFPASQHLVDYIELEKENLALYPDSARTFLPNGGPPAAGQAIRRPEYAETLELVAHQGAGALYQGELGAAVAEDMARNGGLITREDLRRYQLKDRQPVRGTYRGYEVVTSPPVSSGGTHLVQCLNILEAYDLKALGFGTVAYYHLLAETLKLAFADRTRYMGDPDFVDVPIGGLVDKRYAEERRREIDLARARSHSAGAPAAFAVEPHSTTHLTTMDSDGNVVSMTQTVHEAFGSRVTTPGTGMILNNTMYMFDPHPGNANSIAPGKRILSSMTPTLVLKDGKPFLALGTPGGTRIFAAVLQAILNVVDHGMTLQEAVEAPRIWTQGQELIVEREVPQSVRDGLAALGHQVQVLARVAGGMNGILVDPATGLLYGAACWRADGAPVGMSGGPARPGIVGVF